MSTITTFKLTDDERDQLSTLGRGNMAAGLRQALVLAAEAIAYIRAHPEEHMPDTNKTPGTPTMMSLTPAERDQLRTLGDGVIVQGVRNLLTAHGYLKTAQETSREYLRQLREIRAALGLYEYAEHAEVTAAVSQMRDYLFRER